MNNGLAALAVFVKTPGLSPIKTRLAAGIGPAGAEEFYDLSLLAIETTVMEAAEANRFVPYWAVAEESGLSDPRWQRFARVAQGPGGLGQRLHQVFDDLKRRYGSVVAIGADSPQITVEILQTAFDILQRGCDEFVLGRCNDGGFYLVGTNVSLPGELWGAIPYSTPHAADRLAALLSDHGAIHELLRLTDVDEAADLPFLRSELAAILTPSAEQIKLLNWLSQFPAQPQA